MKILFLTDYWFPKKTANAVCVQNIAKELLASGNEVYVCAYKEADNSPAEEDGLHFSYVRPSLARRLMHTSAQCQNAALAKTLGMIGVAINRIRRFLLLPFYPLVSLAFPHRWQRAAEKIIRREKIDVLVSVIAPEEALYTGYLTKKRNPGVEWIIYYIDAGTNILPGTSFERVKRTLQKKASRWENRLFRKADKVIVMEGHANYYRQNLTPQNLPKLRVANVPMLKRPSNTPTQETGEKAGVEKWVYTGNMQGTLYDPRSLCELFIEYARARQAELHLYGPSDHDSYLSEIQEKNRNIFWHGSKPHEEVVLAQKNADVLVYFITRELDSVSGKLFEYLAHRKPIVFLGPENDINVRQLSKFRLGLPLSIAQSSTANATCVNHFLSNIPQNVDIPWPA